MALAVAAAVDPRCGGKGLLETPMLAWVVERALAIHQPFPRQLQTTALEHDTEFVTYLVDQGFERRAPWMVRMLQ